jgi:hypothetical protein
MGHVVANDQNGELMYDHTGIGIVKDNINTSIGMKKMPVQELAQLAEIKITSTGIICMTVLVLALLEKVCQYQYRHFPYANTSISIGEMPILVLVLARLAKI